MWYVINIYNIGFFHFSSNRAVIPVPAKLGDVDFHAVGLKPDVIAAFGLLPRFRRVTGEWGGLGGLDDLGWFVLLWGAVSACLDCLDFRVGILPLGGMTEETPLAVWELVVEVTAHDDVHLGVDLERVSSSGGASCSNCSRSVAITTVGMTHAALYVVLTWSCSGGLDSANGVDG